MSKILLGVSVLLIAAAAYFGFAAKNKIGDLRGESATLTTKSNAAIAAQAKAEVDKKAAEENLAVANTKAEAAAKEATDAKADLTKAQDAVKGLNDQITAKSDEITKLNEQIAKGTGAAPTAAAAPDELVKLQTELKELGTKLAESEELKRTAVARASDAESKAKLLQEQDDKRQGKLKAKGLEGKILAVNDGWSFVVLGIGDRQGVVPNAEMIVVRSGQAIGKVRVSSVEPSTAIADIIPGSLAKGVRVQPGDRVIYPGGA